MKVLNKRTDTIPPDAVYVGRPTKWGNPFVIGKDGTRAEVVEKYRSMLVEKISDRTRWWDDPFYTELAGKDLVCWCAPLPCHADVLLAFACASE